MGPRYAYCSSAGPSAGRSAISASAGRRSIVELDRRLIPVEHGPVHASVTALIGEPGEVEQQGAADPAATLPGIHEEVLR